MTIPVWSVYGLPRIIKNKMDLQRMVTEVPSEYNGVTLCAGSLSSNPDNDIPDIIRSLKAGFTLLMCGNTKHTAPRYPSKSPPTFLRTALWICMRS